MRKRQRSRISSEAETTAIEELTLFEKLESALSVANTLGQPLSTFLQALRLGEYTQRLSDLGFEFTFDLKGISVDKLMEAPDLNMAWGHASRLVNAISHAFSSTPYTACPFSRSRN